MKKFAFILLVMFIAVPVAEAGEGLILIRSSRDVSATADKLIEALGEKGMTVFDRIDHAANAREAGMELRPTLLVIFGNPKVGTPLMQCKQEVAIDLPQKMLIWQDGAGQVWLSYNDPGYLADRHGITGCDEVIEKIGNALSALASTATTP